MLRSKKLLLLALVMVFLCSSLLWAGGTGEAKPAKIGALVPLTGALSEFGQGFRLAATWPLNSLPKPASRSKSGMGIPKHRPFPAWKLLERW